MKIYINKVYVKSVLLVLLFGIYISCTQKNTKECEEAYDEISKIEEGVLTISEHHLLILDLHKKNRALIPCLIEKLDSEKKGRMLFRHPYSSIIHPASHKNHYVGIEYAYLIELIIAKKTIRKNSLDPVFGYLGDRTNNYLYTHGVIVNENDILTLQDMKKIKKIYKKWWKKNRDKPIETVRDNWKYKIDRPLYGTEYHWE